MVEMLTYIFVFGVAWGGVLLATYRMGMMDGRRSRRGAEFKPIIPHKKKKYMASKEQERINAVLENIDNYNGTAEGQKEIRW